MAVSTTYVPDNMNTFKFSSQCVGTVYPSSHDLEAVFLVRIILSSNLYTFYEDGMNASLNICVFISLFPSICMMPCLTSLFTKLEKECYIHVRHVFDRGQFM